MHGHRSDRDALSFLTIVFFHSFVSSCRGTCPTFRKANREAATRTKKKQLFILNAKAARIKLFSSCSHLSSFLTHSYARTSEEEQTGGKKKLKEDGQRPLCGLGFLPLSEMSIRDEFDREARTHTHTLVALVLESRLPGRKGGKGGREQHLFPRLPST